MKKILCAVLALVLMMASCIGLAETVEEVIAKAQTMTNEELYAKAIEESKGQILYGIGNSSRGKTAGASFVEMLKGIDPSYDGVVEWSQPKNNSIFTTLNADIKSANHIYSMTLIQDGNQIQSKMINTGNLLNFIPKDWAEAEGVAIEGNMNPLALQTLNKVFMYNCVGEKTFDNCWDFVAEGEAPLYMGVNSELVGKNFLYMLTYETYANYLKDAFDALEEGAAKDRIAAIVAEMGPEADALMLEAENAAYALTFIKLWCEQYNEQTDDGPICNTLVTASAKDQSGLLVYSKLRSIEESAETSVNNIKIAAYQDGYKGIGGFAYKHYLMIPKTSPLPWTACAFISYMTTTHDGFAAWGKDMGGYSANPVCMQDHSQDGYVDGVNTFDAKNDRGYDWWISADGGRLVVEDPAYCAQVSFDLGDWIDMIVGNK